jgi:hypothetical protein
MVSASATVTCRASNNVSGIFISPWAVDVVERWVVVVVSVAGGSMIANIAPTQ